jgi:protein-S-isoprenylcysteine O-methyltransferase Ste14
MTSYDMQRFQMCGISEFTLYVILIPSRCDIEAVFVPDIPTVVKTNAIFNFSDIVETNVPQYIGALSILVLVALVLFRAGLLRSSGVTALKFGALDKSDFLILPFALGYFYLIFERAWHPADTPWEAWVGVALCAAALLLMVLSLFSFGRSFRVGIDVEGPGALVTSGIFGISRNPMYVAFALLLLGEFLIQPSVVFLAYLLGGLWLFHRQVLREEGYLSEHYGEAYRRYTERVRRYI